MKSIFYKSTAMIIDAAAAIVWTIVVLLFSHNFPAMESVAALLFGILAFILTGFAAYYAQQQAKGHEAEDLSAVPVYYSLAYLGIAAVYNGVTVIADTTQSLRIVLAVNILLAAIYGVLVLLALRYVTRVSETGQKIAAKTNATKAISVQINGLAAIATDEQVKKALLDLKQTVDYSDNVSVSAVADNEAALHTTLDGIMDMLNQGKDSTEILPEIQKAVNLWKVRNSIQSGLR